MFVTLFNGLRMAWKVSSSVCEQVQRSKSMFCSGLLLKTICRWPEPKRRLVATQKAARQCHSFLYEPVNWYSLDHGLTQEGSWTWIYCWKCFHMLDLKQQGVWMTLLWRHERLLLKPGCWRVIIFMGRSSRPSLTNSIAQKGKMAIVGTTFLEPTHRPSLLLRKMGTGHEGTTWAILADALHLHHGKLLKPD